MKMKQTTCVTDINFHLLMKIIRENKMVSHAKTVRLHGMVWPKVNTTDITCNMKF